MKEAEEMHHGLSNTHLGVGVLLPASSHTSLHGHSGNTRDQYRNRFHWEFEIDNGVGNEETIRSSPEQHKWIEHDVKFEMDLNTLFSKKTIKQNQGNLTGIPVLLGLLIKELRARHGHHPHLLALLGKGRGGLNAQLHLGAGADQDQVGLPLAVLDGVTTLGHRINAGALLVGQHLWWGPKCCGQCHEQMASNNKI